MGGSSSPDTSGQNEAARSNAEIAKEMWQQYQDVYLPKEKQYVDDAQNYDSAEHRQQAAEKASGDVSQSYSNARDQMQRDNAQYGISPDDGKFQSTNARLLNAEAAQSAGAQTQARRQVEQTGWDRRTGSLSLGKGLPANAINANSAAGTGFANAANTQMNQNNQASGEIGNAVGGGIGAYNAGANAGYWADGGHVAERHLSIGGPALDKEIASAGAPVVSAPRPAGAGGFGNGLSQGIKAARTGKNLYDTGNKIYNRTLNPQTTTPMTDATAPAAEGSAAMDATSAQTADIGAGSIADFGGAAAAGETAAIGADAAGTAVAAAAPVAAEGIGATALELAPLLLLAKDGGSISNRLNAKGGGQIRGPGTPTSDSVPAWLSKDEYVLNSDAVKHFGIAKLDAMNKVGLDKRYGAAPKSKSS